MTTEVWLRDPFRIQNTLLATRSYRVVVNRIRAISLRKDPIGWFRETYIGSGLPAELLLSSLEGVAHYDLYSSMDKPKAVYPTWGPNMPMEELEGLLALPYVEWEGKTIDRLPEHMRPVEGQEHRIVLTLPDAHTGVGKRQINDIYAMFQDYPDCKPHLYGKQPFDLLFDQGFYSADFDPWLIGPAGGKVYLPNGVAIDPTKYDQITAYEDWVRYLGFAPRDVIKIPRIRAAFNVRSVHWAGEYYTRDLRVKMRYSPTQADVEVPRVRYVPKQDTRNFFRNKGTVAKKSLSIDTSINSDKLICDNCIHRTSCKLFRVESICVVKGAMTVPLADAFGSRNAGRIIEGLSQLLAVQSDRTERAVEDEVTSGEIHPEVTKQINALFRNGVMLAKLLDPSLNGKGVTINNNVNTAQVAVASADPRQLVASAVAALENQGFRRDEISPDMIKLMLSNLAHPEGTTPYMPTPTKMIEGKVVAND